MSLLFEEVCPIPELYDSLLWLGRRPRWLYLSPYQPVATNGVPDPLPRTCTQIDWDVLNAGPEGKPKEKCLYIIRGMQSFREFIPVLSMEMFARMLADGPKVFQPTEEQFESMEHVALDIPVGQFRSPYPVISVMIPPECRRRLFREFNVDPNRMPRAVTVRTWAEPGEPVGILICIRFVTNEVHHIFQDQEGNPTIESAITRMIENNYYKAGVNHDGEHAAATVIGRAALNLLLMMTHYGHEKAGPANPQAWAKHRQKKHLKHLAQQDFEAVRMRQEITVRRTVAPSGLNPPGPGTGTEVAPHWRRGHWRAYPGQGAARAAGQMVPLLFVRPCLVRPDRVRGELSDSEVVYHGA